MRFLITITLLSFLSPQVSANKPGCSSSQPCGEGFGDCDSDRQCRGQLKCGRNNCGSAYGRGWDCCYDPEKKKSGSSRGKPGCSSSQPCNEGAGDCDNDNECRGLLRCGRNNCGSGYASGWDCCYDPAKEAAELDSTLCKATIGTLSAGTGVCAAVSGFLCAPTFGVGCALAAGCGIASAVSGASTNACKRKRFAGEPGSQEEIFMQSSDFNATLQQLEFRNYRESLEDSALGSIDLTSLVRGTDAEQPVREILRVDEAYKSLDKTPKFMLLKENDPAVERFGQTALEILIPQSALSRFLSGNSTVYGGPEKNCGMATANAFEALLIKGTVYFFMGQEIVNEAGPSQNQIDEQMVLLQAHRRAYRERCSRLDIVIDTDKNKRASTPLLDSPALPCPV